MEYEVGSVYMVITEIELKRSVWLRALMIAMVLLATLSIALANLPISIRTLLAAGLLAGIGWGVWQRRKPCPSLRIKSDGQIQLSLAGSDWHHAEVLSGSFVSPGLSVVRLRTADGQLQRLTLLSDSASPEALRRLRVSLRWAPRIHSDRVFPDAG